MADNDMKWKWESCDRRDDPVSGARIIQLTSSAAISNNIYGEQPYCSPDGTRVAIARSFDFNFDEQCTLLVHDLTRLRIARIGSPRGARGAFNSAWSGYLYLWSAARELRRVCLSTLEVETVYVEEDPEAPLPSGSVSPDQRYVIGTGKRLEGAGAPTFQIVRLDLKEGRQEVIFEHPEICNPHLQFNPISGRQILVQEDRGLRLRADGSIDEGAPHEGTYLFSINTDGGDQRYFPVGPPKTISTTGHECFIGDTGRVLVSVTWNHDDWSLDGRFPEGNLLTAAPDDDQPTVFASPEFRFIHVSASRCGRYFVADAYDDHGLFRDGELQSVSLVVGNLDSGKYRVLVEDSMVSGGGNQCTHAHPYLTSDNGHVIYNADPSYSVPQVYAAKVPEGFLESLE